eukprot:5575611-Prymnesium_polylepis.1
MWTDALIVCVGRPSDACGGARRARARVTLFQALRLPLRGFGCGRAHCGCAIATRTKHAPLVSMTVGPHWGPGRRATSGATGSTALRRSVVAGLHRDRQADVWT